ncbi:MAG: hypothetical protein ACLRWQ_12965 [Flavonifractor plautii]
MCRTTCVSSPTSPWLQVMVRDVFEVSKAATGNLSVDIKPIDFVKLLRQTLADMGEAIEESGLALRPRLPESPVWIAADGDRLYRVFQNLIGNAPKYFPGGLPDLPGADRSRRAGRGGAPQHIAGGAAQRGGSHRAVRPGGREPHRRGQRPGPVHRCPHLRTEACGGTFRPNAGGSLHRLRLLPPDQGTAAQGGERGMRRLCACFAALAPAIHDHFLRITGHQ